MAKKPARRSGSYFRNGGSWKSTGPNRPVMRRGSSAFRKSAVASSAPCRRNRCVMRWCALMANAKPSGVAFTHDSRVDAEGMWRKV